MLKERKEWIAGVGWMIWAEGIYLTLLFSALIDWLIDQWSPSQSGFVQLTMEPCTSCTLINQARWSSESGKLESWTFRYSIKETERLRSNEHVMRGYRLILGSETENRKESIWSHKTTCVPLSPITMPARGLTRGETCPAALCVCVYPTDVWQHRCKKLGWTNEKKREEKKSSSFLDRCIDWFSERRCEVRIIIIKADFDDMCGNCQWCHVAIVLYNMHRDKLAFALFTYR